MDNRPDRTDPGARGVFVAFEGGEGAGKSTQAGLLVDHLLDRGHQVVRTREPGGTPAAESIRAVLLDPANDGLDAHAEALLFAAARADHVARVIRPGLHGGAVVVTDRYVDSSVAYQGVGRDLGIEAVARLSDWATGGLLPDLTVLLDLDPDTGLARVGEPDRLEREPPAWHRRVREGFLRRARRAPDRYLVMDATRDPRDLAGEIAAAVDRLLAAGHAAGGGDPAVRARPVR